LGEHSAAFRQDPNELDANGDSAAITTRRSEFAAAQGIIESPVKLEPNIARYHYQFVQILLKLGKAAEAQQEFAHSEKIGTAK